MEKLCFGVQKWDTNIRRSLMETQWEGKKVTGSGRKELNWDKNF